MGPFWYMVYGIWYVVYSMKMVFTVYSHMFHVHHARASYNVVHIFLVIYRKFLTFDIYVIPYKKYEYKIYDPAVLQGIYALHCRQPECDACETYVNTL